MVYGTTLLRWPTSGRLKGRFEENEETIIHNLLGLREVKVHEEMTPRTVVSAFEMHQTIKEILDDNTILRFSRIPVYDETIDNVRGLVIRSEILMAASRDEWDLKLKDIMKPILKLEEESTIEDALDIFLTNKQQFALVRDEFGGTSGILTMEDVMETLLGKEIVDELDEVEDMRELARRQAAQTEDDDQKCSSNQVSTTVSLEWIHGSPNGTSPRDNER